MISLGAICFQILVSYTKTFLSNKRKQVYNKYSKILRDTGLVYVIQTLTIKKFLSTLSYTHINHGNYKCVLSNPSPTMMNLSKTLN